MSVHPLLAWSVPSSSATDSNVLVLVVPTEITLPPFFFVSLMSFASSSSIL